MKNISRRNFLKTTVAATVVLPSMGRDAFGKISANDKVNVGLIGCKGMGWTNLEDFQLNKEIECVALCDIDKSVLDSRADDLVKMGNHEEADFNRRRVI